MHVLYNGIEVLGKRMKKQNILLVLKILETESDKDHPLTQSTIADIISGVYPCDRKTVGRNIGFLINMGYPIVKTPKGFYLDQKLFTVEERELVLSAINSYPDADDQQKAEVVDRLSSIFSKFKK